jgi:hypothetical protein
MAFVMKANRFILSENTFKKLTYARLKKCLKQAVWDCNAKSVTYIQCCHLMHAYRVVFKPKACSGRPFLAHPKFYYIPEKCSF